MKLYVRLLVNNFDETFRFYRDTIGLKPTWGAEGETYAAFEVENGSLDLFSRQEEAKVVGTQSLPSDSPPAQDRILVCLMADKVDDRIEQLREKGVKILVEPHDQAEWGGRVAYIRDPEGNLIEFYSELKQPAAEVPQGSATVV